MADGNDEAHRLLGAMTGWLLVVVNLVLLALLLRETSADGGRAVQIGLTGTGAVLTLVVAANFARRRQKVLEARPDGERA